MRLRIVAALGCCALLAASCSSKPKLECTSESAQSTTIELIRDQLAKAVSATLNSDSSHQFLSSKIRATIQALTITLADIRTSKQDPNSTKRFCVGTLRVQFPTETLADAEKARADANLNTISVLADRGGVDRNADVLSSSFEFDVQPTDKGDKVYSESEDFGKLRAVYAEVVASSLMKAAIDQAKAQAQAASDSQAQQQATAQAAQRSADHEQARTENQLANQTITAVWKNIDPSIRANILDDQRAWIKKKVADCAVEAASASIDATEQDTAKLKCDTRMTAERIKALQAGVSSGAPN